MFDASVDASLCLYICIYAYVYMYIHTCRNTCRQQPTNPATQASCPHRTQTLRLEKAADDEDARQGTGSRAQGLGFIAPLKWIDYGVYGDLIMIYPKSCSTYLRGTIGLRV